MENKGIIRGFCEMIGGGWFRCGTEENDEIWNGSCRILGNPLSLWGLWKWLSSRKLCALCEDLKSHSNGDGGSWSFNLCKS